MKSKTIIRRARATDYRRATKELNELKSHVQSLLQTAKGFFFYRVAIKSGVPPKVQVIMVSPSITEMTGIRDIDNFESWFTNIHPDDKLKVIEANNRSIAAGTPYDQITRWYHPVRREWIWVRTMSQPVFNTQGVLTHYNGLCIDITEQKKAEAERDKLAAELLQSEQNERRRISYILHEDLQQHLVAIKFKLGEVQEKRMSHSSTQIDWLMAELDRTIQLTRDLTVSLRPPILSGSGLGPILDWLATDITAKFGLSVKIAGARAIKHISDDRLMFAYDATRELLMNVVKHAGVTKARIRFSPQGRKQFLIEVNDKGTGFTAIGKSQKTFGLSSIKERAAILGGDFTIVSEPGKGTCARLVLPI